MEGLAIQQREERDDGWSFDVGHGSFSWSVSVDREHWRQITDERESPAELVRASLAYLLEREGPEQILSTFDLRDISRYFPDYENDIKKYLPPNS